MFSLFLFMLSRYVVVTVNFKQRLQLQFFEDTDDFFQNLLKFIITQNVDMLSGAKYFSMFENVTI